jgi:hypothetical protein
MRKWRGGWRDSLTAAADRQERAYRRKTGGRISEICGSSSASGGCRDAIDVTAPTRNVHRIALLGPIPALLVLGVWLAGAVVMARGNRRVRRLAAVAAPARWPKVSIVFAARNEGATLGAAVPTLLALDYPDFEVIAVDDRSEEQTRFTGGRRAYGLLLPLGIVVFGYIMLRSMVVTHATGGITWRGTHYRLAELKRNRV